MRSLRVLAVLPILAACSGGSGDPHAIINPDPLGNGSRIRDITNPNLATHPKPVMNPVGGVLVNDPVRVTGAVVLWYDTFDETQDGKSRGTVYAQDIGTPQAYSGIGIFSPTYVPADLRVAPGDVLDFNGPYEELASIGSAKFQNGQVLAQLSKPVGTFRYEYSVPKPQAIDVMDLADYNKGRQWLGMLVTVSNVTLGAGTIDTSGHRVTYTMNGTVGSISNELFDLKNDKFPAGTTLKSVTGIVTWFFSYHIAPRTLDDLVQ
jgi:hypothetical protein